MNRLAPALTALTLLAAPAALADPYQWDIDPTNSDIGFIARHLSITKVRGEFMKWDAKVIIDDKDMTKSKIEIDIDAASIDTENEKRNNHLKSDDFFNAAKYPKLKFRSKSINKKKNNHYTMVGDLTIRDVTKVVVIEWDASPVIKDPGGNEHIAFSGTTEINRFDYGLKWSKAVEGGGLVVSEVIKIELEMELKNKRPVPAAP